MAKPLTLQQLNELMVKVYQRRIIRQLYNDPTLPWLPEQSWRDDFERNFGNHVPTIGEPVEDYRTTKVLRQHEDDRLAKKVDAVLADLLEEAPSLLGDNETLKEAGWGRDSMHNGRFKARPPSIGNPQPVFCFECYQCGRPITVDGKDHARRKSCDHALVDGDDWDLYHRAKPVNGEEDEDRW